MTMDDIIGYVSGLDGVLALRPREGDGTPEIAWGDTFFYYSPDGSVPTNVQPFATIVTKDYPEDGSSRLDRPGFFRLNIADVSRSAVAQADADPSDEDVVFPHPVYGRMGWVSIVNPGERTDAVARELLEAGYRTARSRYERRASR
ncbi:DUF6194 family protein [Catenuloplanes japonicus]|uniref:DUF6194 family protein n=1 Tax=Catenuloplanes japonicus TaxID=33876 RepID=UPI00052598AF|nr:DUF6194 family protein [Catenuloplanes japonicus]